MKKSGHKVVIIFSTIVIGLMLIVPVLPVNIFQSGVNLCDDAPEKNAIEETYFMDSSRVYVGFSIGREISFSF